MERKHQERYYRYYRYVIQICDSLSCIKNVPKLGMKSYLPFVGVITPSKEEVRDTFLFRQ